MLLSLHNSRQHVVYTCDKCQYSVTATITAGDIANVLAGLTLTMEDEASGT